MNASAISRAMAVLGKYLPPEKMKSFIDELKKLKTPIVDWNFPLSEALVVYNHELLELIKGHCTLNYSETALVIQNSTNVFERRVENLHTDTCGLREDLNEHDAKNEAAKSSKPRQRSNRNKFDLDTIERVDFLKDITKNCFLKQKKPLKKPKLLSQRYPQLENMCRHKFSLNVIDTQGDNIGKKYDFRCNQQLTSSHMLVDELSPEDLHKFPGPPMESSTPLHHPLYPSYSTSSPISSPGPSNYHPDAPGDDPSNFISRHSTSSLQSPTLGPQDMSDLEEDDFFYSHDADPLNHTQESGYCTITDISITSVNLNQTLIENVISSSKKDTIPEDSREKSQLNSAADALGPGTPPEDVSPVPAPPNSSLVPPQEDSIENSSLQRKRNRESVETDAGYTSGGPEDVPMSPKPVRRSKRLKQSVVNELNEKSYQAIPFEAPIPEKSKSRASFQLPCDISLLRSNRPRKRKIDAAARRDAKLKKHLLDGAEERNKLHMYSPSRSLCDHYRQENKEFHRIFGESFKTFNVSQFDAVLGDNDELRGFSPRVSGMEVKENLKLASEVIDQRLQELQETSCSYTPPHSPDFSGGFEIHEDECVEEEDLGEPSSSTLTHQQRIEKRMKELQQEFDVRHDREEETAKWFDMMETLRRAERRPVFDVREYEGRILKNLGDEPGNRLGFEELARREEPEDIARLFVASLHLANTYEVDITANEDQSNVHLSLLTSDRSQPS